LNKQVVSQLRIALCQSRSRRIMREIVIKGQCECDRQQYVDAKDCRNNGDGQAQRLPANRLHHRLHRDTCHASGAGS
jgi:hypothetical protein